MLDAWSVRALFELNTVVTFVWLTVTILDGVNRRRDSRWKSCTDAPGLVVSLEMNTGRAGWDDNHDRPFFFFVVVSGGIGGPLNFS